MSGVWKLCNATSIKQDLPLQTFPISIEMKNENDTVPKVCTDVLSG
jgi:hypothetical protein